MQAPNVSLHLDTEDGIVADAVPDHDHATVELGRQVRIFSTDPEVMEQAARAFWDAADVLRYKQRDRASSDSVARTLAIATGQVPA